jgi:hypothetical protein
MKPDLLLAPTKLEERAYSARVPSDASSTFEVNHEFTPNPPWNSMCSVRLYVVNRTRYFRTHNEGQGLQESDSRIYGEIAAKRNPTFEVVFVFSHIDEVIEGDRALPPPTRPQREQDETSLEASAPSTFEMVSHLLKHLNHHADNSHRQNDRIMADCERNDDHFLLETASSHFFPFFIHPNLPQPKEIVSLALKCLSILPLIEFHFNLTVIPIRSSLTKKAAFEELCFHN